MEGTALTIFFHIPFRVPLIKRLGGGVRGIQLTGVVDFVTSLVVRRSSIAVGLGMFAAASVRYHTK